MRSLHRLLLSCLFSLQIWEGICQECGKEEYLNDNGNCTSCRKCPRGQEPNGVCGFGTGAVVGCRACAPGTFSSRHDMSPCTMHTQCIKKKRIQLTAGTANADAVCKGCLPGYFPLVANSSNTCIPCWLAPPDTVGCEGQRTLRNRSPRTLEAPNNSEQKSPQNSTHKGAPDDSRTQYAVLAIVPVFCMMGLTGILLCNILKKKGYRCTSQKVDEEAAPEKDGNIMMEENGNEDTIGVLVRLITEKKENAVALEELLKEYQTKQTSTSGDKSPQNKLHLLPQMPILCKHQHHLHTVQGPASRSNTCCTRCSQKKWPDFISPPQSMVVPNNNGKGGRTSAKAALGEITILSVGRFCVARIPEQKPNPPEVKPNSEAGAMDASGRPENEVSEQKLLLLSNTVRAKKRSLEDTSKLEDVI
ncbi:tumor necrosis factor receptor superfamily member 19L [Bufo gargarizans]|uniref:tumor necrosis factor receptor superfamily member 19L n=1 Tax=Bufo gargarizans TaxID=30331 RepID=UPI001CF2FFDC|nr:tumor necrosis factor receptor superfamily member 19L [Bufo gargarizans]XP_044143657.1 tumor necrosis factor receptor superfamily member 19L [Bufo gargarizans]XP_044143658.1 tumor necrosis factor receptor superfamily member 19L [Bufo gargarizans]XP_044143659.1 tumor necrosis factor receptor superfamily member 19L [Bufo gargarizans]